MAHAIPTNEQLAWQKREFGMFIHFGINTFAGLEWSDGTVPASEFNPSELDARQWARTAKEAGASYLILTAKHHDGFCLWPTKTTDYSVASSPWRLGDGDVVRETAAACAEYGLGFGVYLSPWDRNAACYGDPPAYDDFYIEQLTELCSSYGLLMELWFDGAGSEGRVYDWTRIAKVIKALQPKAMVFNMGDPPTIRWVGNEDGLAHDPVTYAARSTDNSQYTKSMTDLGETLYLPPECDVSIRRGWFWHADDEPKTAEHLLAIYYRSVGMGANLLLNVPPDTRGLIGGQDVARLRQWRAELNSRFAHRIECSVTPSLNGATLTLPAEATFAHVELVEQLSNGQRIAAHRITAKGQELAAGMTVGSKRIHQVPLTTAAQIQVELDGDHPLLLAACVYGGSTPWSRPQVPAGYTAPTDAPP